MKWNGKPSIPTRWRSRAVFPNVFFFLWGGKIFSVYFVQDCSSSWNLTSFQTWSVLPISNWVELRCVKKKKIRLTSNSERERERDLFFLGISAAVVLNFTLFSPKSSAPPPHSPAQAINNDRSLKPLIDLSYTHFLAPPYWTPRADHLRYRNSCPLLLIIRLI